jgi:hypothetical protein
MRSPVTGKSPIKPTHERGVHKFSRGEFGIMARLFFATIPSRVRVAIAKTI